MYLLHLSYHEIIKLILREYIKYYRDKLNYYSKSKYKAT